MQINLNHFKGNLQNLEQPIWKVYADRKGTYSHIKQSEQLKEINNNCQQNLIYEVRQQLI